MAIEQGKPAPPFTLDGSDGEPVSLADFRGKDLILYFYPRDETPGCTKEACAFRDLWKEIRAEGVELVGVSPDSAESHREFATNHRLPFRLLSDPERRMMAAYGAFGEKTMYGRKVKGVIRSTVWIGPDGRVKRHWAKVASAAEHPAKVLAAVRAEGGHGTEGAAS